jgi:MarR family transcriptional regulator, negative regulator of the multidrug operon emrRAB
MARVAGSSESRAAAIASRRLPNTVAALALAVTDMLLVGLDERYHLGPSDAAALIILSRRSQRIEDISQQLGVSHSATVRLVDRLEDMGLAGRAPGRDARSVNVRLTAAGKRRARGLLTERERIMTHVLGELSERDRRLLGALVEKMLDALAVDWRTTMQICRLCNIPFCESGAACPAAAGAARRELLHAGNLRNPAS